MEDYFIQDALKHHKKGALHKELDISMDQIIPESLLNEIHNAKIGETITNTSGVGKKRIYVTRLLEERANLARTLRHLKK